MTDTKTPDSSASAKPAHGSVLGAEREGWLQRGYVPAAPNGHVSPPSVIMNQPSSVIPPKK